MAGGEWPHPHRGVVVIDGCCDASAGVPTCKVYNWLPVDGSEGIMPR
jgi:hypothetical protein